VPRILEFVLLYLESNYLVLQLELMNPSQSSGEESAGTVISFTLLIGAGMLGVTLAPTSASGAPPWTVLMGMLAFMAGMSSLWAP